MCGAGRPGAYHEPTKVCQLYFTVCIASAYTVFRALALIRTLQKQIKQTQANLDKQDNQCDHNSQKHSVIKGQKSNKLQVKGRQTDIKNQ